MVGPSCPLILLSTECSWEWVWTTYLATGRPKRKIFSFRSFLRCWFILLLFHKQTTTPPLLSGNQYPLHAWQSIIVQTKGILLLLWIAPIETILFFGNAPSYPSPLLTQIHVSQALFLGYCNNKLLCWTRCCPLYIYQAQSLLLLIFFFQTFQIKLLYLLHRTK